MSFISSYYAGGSQAYQLYQIALDVQSLQQTLKSGEIIEIFAVDIHTLGMVRPTYPIKSASSTPNMSLSLIVNDGYSVYTYSVLVANTANACDSLRTRTNDSGTVYENLTNSQVSAGSSYIYYIKYRQS